MNKIFNLSVESLFSRRRMEPPAQHVSWILLTLALFVSAAKFSAAAQAPAAPRPAAQPQPAVPHLAHEHGANQIVVNGRPFLVRGGELENSSASSLSYLDTVWPRVETMHFNTVLAPVYWQLIEPREGSFDFTLVETPARSSRFALVGLSSR